MLHVTKIVYNKCRRPNSDVLLPVLWNSTDIAIKV